MSLTTNSSIDPKFERFTSGPIQVSLFNFVNPDAFPAPLTISKRNNSNPLRNKFILSVLNNGEHRLVLGGPNLSGLYVNFSDLMSLEDMENISVSINGTPVHASVVYPMLTMQINGRDVATPSNPALDPTLPPAPNIQHLGLWQANEPVIYIWPQKELELLPQEPLMVQLDSVSSDFRPALRYLNVSWEMVVRPFLTNEEQEKPLEGFTQITVQLQRPPDYVEPPLPIHAHWLHGENVIFTTKGADEKIVNELHFALSNTGLYPFSLDCSKHSRGVPYFELVMVGKKETDAGNFSSAIADTSDLALAELEDTSLRENLNQLWRSNKRIQGPVVKWEIRPDLDYDWKIEGPSISDRKKILLGTDLDATITFRLHTLQSSLEDGVALVYLRYYNMPEHDDGQLILYIEKRRIEIGKSLTPQLKKEKNALGLPMSWRIEKDGNDFKTFMQIGEEVRKEVEAFGRTHNILVKKHPLLLSILGDTHIAGQATISALDVQNEENTSQTKDQPATLSLVGVKKGSDMHRTATIRAEGEDNNKGSKLVFSTRSNDNDKKSLDHLTIDSKGRVGIGITKPTDGLHLKNKNQRIENGSLKIENGKLEADEVVIKKITGKEDNQSIEFLKQHVPTLETYAREPAVRINDSHLVITSGDLVLFNQCNIYTNTNNSSDIGLKDIPFRKIYAKYVYADGVLLSSDRSLKNNISPLSSKYDALSLIQKIDPVSYTLKEEKTSPRTHFGFIANDIELLLPDAVHKEEGEGSRSLEYQALNTLLFQAVKDQQRTIDQLFSTVADLQQSLKALQKEVEIIKKASSKE